MKFFLLLGLFFVAVWLIRGGRRRGLPGTPPQTPAAPSGGDGRPSSESVVACVHCGLHLPKSEAVSGAAGWFCGDAHRLAHDVAKPR